MHRRARRGRFYLARLRSPGLFIIFHRAGTHGTRKGYALMCASAYTTESRCKSLSFRGSLVCLVALACILRAGMCLSTYLRAAVARVVTYVGQRVVCKHVPAHVARTRGLFCCRGAKEALPTRANACLAPFHPRLFPLLTHLLTLRDGNSDRDDVHKPRGGPAEIGISCAATRIYRSMHYIRWIDQVCA